ncbi:MAG: DUF1592 domain-containing protein [Myxococcales bacterium]|nr:DUF1592 domain-containing protein [Myxococcales bacterium]
MLTYLAMGLFGCGQGGVISEATVEMGRAPLRRLNRIEYDNTMRDLMGVDTNPSRWLPPDEEAFDFHTIADALNVGPLHIDSMDIGADEVLNQFFGPVERTYIIEAEGSWMSRDGAGQRDGNGFYVLESGALRTTIDLPHAGTYLIEVDGYGAAGGSPTVTLHIDDEPIGDMVFAVPPGSSFTRSFEVELDLGYHNITLQRQLGSVGIDAIDITGPINITWEPSDHYSRIMLCDVREEGVPCARRIIGGFQQLAWRRAIEESDVDWAMPLYELGYAEGGTPEDGLRHAFKATLMAPDFLFRPEVGPEVGGDPRELDGYEIASRLSYFLWSSTPDDQLLQAAADGTLADPDVLRQQTQRMLLDPRSTALVDSMASQWLDIDELLEDVNPDPTLYPGFDDELRVSMAQEMRLMANDFIRGDMSLVELLTTHETTIDQRLALLYGLDVPPAADVWTTVSMEGEDRMGILGTAGWMTAHSKPEGPSVVQRGKWVLNRLLCSAPPQPPPDINQDLDLRDTEGSVREQEERQRSVEPCHTCHQVMDPIGFSIGRFDGIGADRIYDELGYRIDTRVELEGAPAESLQDLADFVITDPRLNRCFAEKVFTFALSRPPADDDQRTLDSITSTFTRNGMTFPALVNAIVTHPVFRHRGDYREIP